MQSYTGYVEAIIDKESGHKTADKFKAWSSAIPETKPWELA